MLPIRSVLPAETTVNTLGLSCRRVWRQILASWRRAWSEKWKSPLTPATRLTLVMLRRRTHQLPGTPHYVINISLLNVAPMWLLFHFIEQLIIVKVAFF